MEHRDEIPAMRIGWAQGDITPSEPVLIAGQFHARLSEGVMDPLTATALALESGEEQAVLVSCDLVSIPDDLRDKVRSHIKDRVNDLAPDHVVLSATHTHTGPELRRPDPGAGNVSAGTGVELAAMRLEDCVDMTAERIARVVEEAWAARSPGKFAFGLGHAVVGRNRRWVNTDAASTMYGNTDTPGFSHIEGYEDHSVNILATYDESDSLTGLVVNVPSPSQVTEGAFMLSADYWHETRQELRKRLGADLFVLAQCSAAGDQSPHLLYEKRAEARMIELAQHTERQEIACRISDAVQQTLHLIVETADERAMLHHHVESLELPMTTLTEEDVKVALNEAETWRERYEEEKRKLEADPDLRHTPRWYVPVTRARRRMMWYRAVSARYEQQQTTPTRSVELHVIRLGDVAFATNPFEYYLDYGVHIKCRSKAVQTFLVQLAGAGTYVPSARSVQGGGYGSVPASNPFGPEAGRMVAEKTVEIIDRLWQ